MPEALTNYQCPNCNGPLHYEERSEKLKCDNCGSLFTIEEINNYFEEKNSEAISVDMASLQQEAKETLQWSEEEAAHLRAYNCPSCGAQLITDDTTAATSCPYCGNPTIVPQQFSGSLKPDYIIPFKVNKDDAIKALNNFYTGKPFLPSQFKSQNHIEEIKGIYVPFWLYDTKVHTNMQFQATNSHIHRTHDEIVTITDHYSVGRQGIAYFEKVPADASKSMPDDLMDSIEPFDYNALQSFTPSYLPGYLADRYDVDNKEDEERIRKRVYNSAVEEIKSTVIGYDSVWTTREDVNVEPTGLHYAFFPVWLLTTKYKDKIYLFAVNGQTNKVAGDTLPISWLKFFLTFIIITIIGLALIYYLV